MAIKTMLKGLCVAGLMSLSSLSMALDYAIADVQTAINGTTLYQKAISDLEAGVKPQRTQLEALSKDLEAMDARLQRDGKLLNETDKRNLQNQMQSKVNEYNTVTAVIQKKLQDADTKMMNDLLPKLQTVAEALCRENGYKGIIEKKSMFYIDHKAGVDITSKITERLNQIK